MKSTILLLEGLSKWKKILLLSSPIISLLISMKTAIIGLVVLILLDLLTGIGRNMRDWKIKANPFTVIFWKSIKSYLLRKTWKKAYEYGIGIIVVAVFETLILGATPVSIMEKVFTLTELSVVIPATIEIWSIFENLEEVSGKNVLKRLVMLLPASLQTLLTGKKVESEVIEEENTDIYE